MKAYEIEAFCVHHTFHTENQDMNELCTKCLSIRFTCSLMNCKGSILFGISDNSQKNFITRS